MTRLGTFTALAGGGLAVAASAALAIIPVADAVAQTVGINAAIRNRVTIRAAGAPRPRPAVMRERVGLNDEVRTGGDSRLQILLLDRSVLTVGSDARLTIDRFVYDPNRSAGQVSASVMRGAFRFLSGRSLALPSRRVSVRTPVATIGVRGTIVEGVVGDQATDIARGEAAVGAGIAADPDSATLIILRGPGRNTHGNTRPGAIDVESGEGVVALDQPGLALFFPGAGQRPIGPFVMSREGLSRLYLLLFPFAAPQTNAPPSEGSEQEDADLGIRTRDRSALPWLAALSVLPLVLVIADSDGARPVSP